MPSTPFSADYCRQVVEPQGRTSLESIVNKKTSHQGAANRPWREDGISCQGRLGVGNPAMTDFRARGTIMGLAGLTAVFGMGTGVTPPVWSPEKRLAGG